MYFSFLNYCEIAGQPFGYFIYLNSMLRVIIVLWMLWGASLQAQVHFDANWVFGKNCGVSFLDTANPTPFYAFSENLDATTSISDTLGNLLFYAGGDGPLFMENPRLFGADNQTIPGSEDIKLDLSVTNGLSIVPAGHGKYLLFHIYSDITWFCGSAICNRLFYSVIQQNLNGSFTIGKKNVLIGINTVQEKLLLAKHANGFDWWLITKEHALTDSCTNKFVKYLVQADTVVGPFTQQEGYLTCDESDYPGEIALSKDGKTIAMCYAFQGTIEILDLNRCTGELELLDTIQLPGLYPLGASFSNSGDLLYISMAKQGGPILNQGLYQLHLNSQKRFISIDTIFSVPANANYFLGHLEPAPDDRIYLSTLIQTNLPFPENKHLGVINYPDLPGAACGFEQYGLAVGDSCFTKLGLPNMPNYNLSALGPYRMNAGADKVICTNDMSQTGVTIGSPIVPGISYQWISEEIDSSDRDLAQVMVNPDSSTLYYIQITDSSYSGSCTNSYIDSVLVEVKECPLVSVPQIENVIVQVYPNPAKDKLNFLLSDNWEKVNFGMYTLLGERVKMVTIEHQTQLDISDLATGVYIYQVEYDGKRYNGKIIVE